MTLTEKKNVAAALGGIYTIGGSSPDFTDFNAAVTPLNLGGVYSPVTFNVRSGTYAEQVIITDFVKTDSAHKVTFQSEVGDSSAVILKYSITSFDQNYVVRLNGSRGLTFKQMTLYSVPNYSYGRVVQLDSGASDINFRNAWIKSDASTDTDDDKALVVANDQFTQSYLSFDQVLFQHGSYGLYLDANYSQSAQGIQITNCVFEENYYRGAYLENAEAVVFKDNLIQPKSNHYSYYQATYFNGLSGVHPQE
ncbi:MAG: hypothetical protein U5L96_21420 [Owenweeksia sp.]|nr:hypothetical protein [Owenweeksia sp.]